MHYFSNCSDVYALLTDEVEEENSVGWKNRAFWYHPERRNVTIYSGQIKEI